MIKNIQIPADDNSVISKCWGNRTIEFTDGVNIIFGPNGCGKSVLLQTLAHYTGIDKRGWSCGLTTSSDRIDDQFKNYDFIVNKTAKLGTAKIQWDGVAAYLSETNRDITSILINLMGGGDKEEIDLTTALSVNRSHMSSGQSVSYYINNILNLQVPDLTIPFNAHKSSLLAEYGMKLVDYVKTLPRDGKPTLLLDEPDKSLDFANQHLFYNDILDKLAEKYQVIVVTHSVFALARAGANIIDQNGYFAASKAIVYQTFSKSI